MSACCIFILILITNISPGCYSHRYQDVKTNDSKAGLKVVRLVNQIHSDQFEFSSTYHQIDSGINLDLFKKAAERKKHFSVIFWYERPGFKKIPFFETIIETLSDLLEEKKACFHACKNSFSPYDNAEDRVLELLKKLPQKTEREIDYFSICDRTEEQYPIMEYGLFLTSHREIFLLFPDNINNLLTQYRARDIIIMDVFSID